MTLATAGTIKVHAVGMPSMVTIFAMAGNNKPDTAKAIITRP